jgi:3D-(3,5/4)-trihydroxycyclohexane-1,2-dione acylhydrolase (decyclizing)
VIRVTTMAELRAGLDAAKAADRTTVVHVSTDPMEPGPDGGAWWDVPVAEVSATAAAQAARAAYEAGRKARRTHLRPG